MSQQNAGKRRWWRRRQDLGPFASAEAKKAAEAAIGYFEITMGELLAVGTPTGEGNRWTLKDVHAAEAVVRQWKNREAPPTELPEVEGMMAADDVALMPCPNCGVAIPPAERATHVESCRPVEQPAAPGLRQRLTGLGQGLRGWAGGAREWLSEPATWPLWEDIPGVVKMRGWFAAGGNDSRRATIWLTAALLVVLLLLGGMSLIVVRRGAAPAVTSTPAAAILPVIPTATPTQWPPSPTPVPTEAPIVEAPAAAAVVTTTVTVSLTVAEAITPTLAATSTLPLELPVEKLPVAPPPPALIKGHIENGGGVAVRLVGVGVVTTTADASGNYTFTNVVAGFYYGVEVGGGASMVPVTVTAGKVVTVTELHRVVKGDTLWDIYGAHSWSDFTALADAHGLTHFVNDRGTPDTADDLLIVVIQPGQIFDLAAMAR